MTAVGRIVDAWNAMLEHDPDIRILGEMKPNEPMDQAYLPTVGHFLGLAYATADPSRFGVLIETAHSILAGPRPVRRHGLRPLAQQALERPPQRPERPEVRPGQGLRLGRPAPGVQPGLGAREERLRPQRQCVGLDVKAMRTTVVEDSMFHLAHSKTMFLRLLDIVRGIDEAKVEELRAGAAVRAARDADPQRADGTKMSGR